jgi:predicted RNA binding protein YcfA (HicA-like mRNA interferase family)
LILFIVCIIISPKLGELMSFPAIGVYQKTLLATASSSSSLPNPSALASLDAPLAVIKKSKASAPFLTKFYADNSIPRSFSLPFEHEDTLRCIFSKWKLDAFLTLHDVLSLEIREEFAWVCGAYQGKDELLNVVSENLMMSLSLSLRLDSKVTESSKLHIPKFFGSFKVFEQNILKEFNDLKQAKKSSFDKTTNLQLRNKLILASDKRMEHLEKTLDVFFFCLNSPHRVALLLKRSISSYEDGEKIGEQSELSLKHLQLLTRHHFALTTALNPFLSAKLDFTPFVAALEVPLESLMQSPSIILRAVSEFDDNSTRFGCDIANLAKGTITAEEWYQGSIPSMPLNKRHTSAALQEWLYLHAVAMKLTHLFLKDLHRILETSVLQQIFPNQYVPRIAMFRRLMMNLVTIQNIKLIDDQDFFRIGFRGEIKRLFNTNDTLLDTYTGRSKNYEIAARNPVPIKKRPPTNHLSIDELTDSHIEWIRPDIDKFAHACATLQEEIPEIMKRLAHGEFRSIETLRKIAFEESQAICLIAVVIRDARAIFGSKDLDFDIPAELADFIQLEGIEGYLPSSIPLPDSPRAMPQASVAPPKTQLPPIVQVAPLAAASSSSDAAQSNDLFTIGTKNLRKVMKMLQQAGFTIYRTRGHHIYKNKQDGAPTHAPHGGDLPLGTVRSIQEQARAALGDSL